jgi:hypothetical protein
VRIRQQPCASLAKQIPKIAPWVSENGHATVRFMTRRPNDLAARCDAALQRSFEVSDAEEHPDPTCELSADGGKLFGAVSER